jgi:hypothetical protein
VQRGQHHPVDAATVDTAVIDPTVGGDTNVPGFDADLPDRPFTWCPAGPPVPYDGSGLIDSGSDVKDICDFFTNVPCGLPPGLKTGVYGDLSTVDCSRICTVDAAVLNCRLLEASDTPNLPDAPAILMICATCLGGGRRPEGLEGPAVGCDARARNAIGEYLAGMAHLEAASVHAFRQMRRELVAHGAPRHLVRGASRSARDEVRHARVTTRLARRYGSVPARPSIRPAPQRTLDAIAIENVVEGCVRETFGAMIATWQMHHAKDPEVAAAMRGIAADETRHAALAWAVAKWVERRLDAKGRAHLARARRAAVRSLRAEVLAAVPRALVDALGLPAASQAGALVDAMDLSLWA